ncbi:hypothetical protein [Pseudomonas cichorii]|uniref:hypothetical protein n=1 Tax=Pseudomonas cichorii TaxID=36746 RepID=UPI001C89F988|nr:hypothetical protein [Pseudomonas cichorii]MBX8487491.1 hypothetical protein [Pseudomonas cichorii]
MNYKQLLRLVRCGVVAVTKLCASPFRTNSSDKEPLIFKRTPSGVWEARDGYYRVSFEGRRVGHIINLHVDGRPEASIFVWSERDYETDVTSYIWTLGARPEVGETRVGKHTYTSIFLAMFKAFNESEKVTVVYDPTIQNTVLDRWGP